MEAFRRSGVLGTPQYTRVLLIGFGFIGLGLAISINGLVTYSRGNEIGRFVLSILLLVGCAIGLVFATGSIRARLRARGQEGKSSR